MDEVPKPRELTKEDHFSKDMDFHLLLTEIGLNNREVEATIINPLRHGDEFKKGRVTGFKSGLFGGGHSNYENGVPTSYDSTKRHWIKKPKVHVTYYCFEWGKGEYSDWVTVDNCVFNIVKGWR